MNSSSSALDELDDTTEPWLHDSVRLSANGMLADCGQGSVPSNGDAKGVPLGICNVKSAGVTDGSFPCTMQIVALLTDGVMESLSLAIGVPCGGEMKIDSSSDDDTLRLHRIGISAQVDKLSISFHVDTNEVIESATELTNDRTLMLSIAK